MPVLILSTSLGDWKMDRPQPTSALAHVSIQRVVHVLAIGLVVTVTTIGCNQNATPTADNAAGEVAAEQVVLDTAAETANVIVFEPGPDAQQKVLEELILAEPGSIFQFEEGVFNFTEGLSLTVADVTIRGRGMDKTILNFKEQTAGAEGLYITSDNVLVEDLAIEDTKGNGLKSLKANNIVLRRVRAEWTGGPKSTNGAYGLYPVSSENVLIEECVAIGGSDSGIYVGQSRNVIVRNCKASFNVAGIEIENCHQAEVSGCEATNNTGGILVFDLPDLPQQHGHDVRVFNNQIFNNNTENFAPEGNIVGTVPSGTGVMVMANTNVEIFDNVIRDHQTSNVLIVSYLMTGIEIKDEDYYPYAETIHIHGNKFGPGGQKPAGAGGKMMEMVLGNPIPDIVWDGVVNPENMVDGRPINNTGISVHSNSKLDDAELTFANMGGLATLQNPLEPQVTRDLAPYAEPFPPVAPVVIPGVE
jgi:parallel beta-helix repeat protein